MINVVEFHFVPSGKLRRLGELLVQSRFPLPKKETFLARCSNQNTGVVFLIHTITEINLLKIMLKTVACIQKNFKGQRKTDLALFSKIRTHFRFKK